VKSKIIEHQDEMIRFTKSMIATYTKKLVSTDAEGNSSVDLSAPSVPLSEIRNIVPKYNHTSNAGFDSISNYLTQSIDTIQTRINSVIHEGFIPSLKKLYAQISNEMELFYDKADSQIAIVDESSQKRQFYVKMQVLNERLDYISNVELIALTVQTNKGNQKVRMIDTFSGDPIEATSAEHTSGAAKPDNTSYSFTPVKANNENHTTPSSRLSDHTASRMKTPDRQQNHHQQQESVPPNIFQHSHSAATSNHSGQTNHHNDSSAHRYSSTIDSSKTFRRRDERENFNRTVHIGMEVFYQVQQPNFDGTISVDMVPAVILDVNHGTNECTIRIKATGQIKYTVINRIFL
jgi:hypothetical protein